MSQPLPAIIEANETTFIDEGWYLTLAQRKRELLRPFGSTTKPFIAVFGSAMTARGTLGWRRAEQVGAELAKLGATVINGGYAGVMEASAEGAKKAGGITVGVTCNDLPEKQANASIIHEWRCERWDQRLIALVWLADGYVVMPGSSGTLVELAMVIETQLKSFIPIRNTVCFGAFWKPVVKRITGTTKIVHFAGTARSAARLAIGAPAPLKVRHRTARHG